jgi:hypothetical protein
MRPPRPGLEEKLDRQDSVQAELARKQRDEYDRLRRRVEALQSSRSYRLMRILWRISPAVRQLFRRSRRQKLRPVSGSQPPASAKPRGSTESRSAREGDGEVRVKPERSKSQPTDPSDLRVAAVLDEMSANCFGPECDLLTFGSEHWEERLEEHQPHMLLVESAWRGNGESWRYQVGTYRARIFANYRT